MRVHARRARGCATSTAAAATHAADLFDRHGTGRQRGHLRATHRRRLRGLRAQRRVRAPPAARELVATALAVACERLLGRPPEVPLFQIQEKSPA